MPQRVAEPPDVQCSNLLATATIILLLVLKNAKKISNGGMGGKLFKTLIYWQYLFCKEIISKT